jgi:hypothetical protein
MRKGDANCASPGFYLLTPALRQIPVAGGGPGTRSRRAGSRSLGASDNGAVIRSGRLSRRLRGYFIG